jgi:hypothetical protein
VVLPKKRKTLHARRSKRATLPDIINDDEWACLNGKRRNNLSDMVRV